MFNAIVLDLALESFPVLLYISLSTEVLLRSCNLQAIGTFYQAFDQSLNYLPCQRFSNFLLPPRGPFTKSNLLFWR